MGAEITWYVKVTVPMEKILSVEAVTSTEAEQEVRRQYADQAIISVLQVFHQDELCHNCGTLLPDGCGGLFESDGKVCLRYRRRSSAAGEKR